MADMGSTPPGFVEDPVEAFAEAGESNGLRQTADPSYSTSASTPEETRDRGSKDSVEVIVVTESKGGLEDVVGLPPLEDFTRDVSGGSKDKGRARPPSKSAWEGRPQSANSGFVTKTISSAAGATWDVENHLPRLASKRRMSKDVKRAQEIEVRAASKVSTVSSVTSETRWAFVVLGKFAINIMQKYSLPLIFGVVLALVWSNVDSHSYHEVIDTPLWEGANFDGHDLTLHFLVNDIFMCFFFGLAIKEVTEALLPGGSLNPISRAVNPLMATLGGVVGPAGLFMVFIVILHAVGMFDDQMCMKVKAVRRLGGGGGGAAVTMVSEECVLGDLLKGWGVPTATDISLAWMFALQVFGPGHPAINFMLLLAIVDDAIGMVIIAAYYGDPANPVKPAFLSLVVAASILTYVFRRLSDVPYWGHVFKSWLVYVFICGPISWYGLIKAHVHPALALVFVVPLMPASHALEVDDPNERNLGRCNLAPEAEKAAQAAGGLEKVPEDAEHSMQVAPPRAASGYSGHGSGSPGRLGSERSLTDRLKDIGSNLMLIHEDEAPLHVFEEQIKLPVDLGMFFFGLANAGVSMGSVGGMTIAVYAALLVGKTFGIVFFSLVAVKAGYGLPTGMYVGDLVAMAAIAGVGLTVALFVSNEAFVDPDLRGQAKMGALFSVTCGGFGWAFRKLLVKQP